MATLTATNPEIVQSSTTPQIVELYAATSTTWKAGELLRVNTSGEAVAVSDGATTGGITHQAILDRASADAAGYVKAVKLTDDMVLKIHVSSGTVSEANIGQQYGIGVASNVHTIDTSDSTAVFQILDLGYLKDAARYDAADTVAVVYAKLLSNIIEAAPQS